MRWSVRKWFKLAAYQTRKFAEMIDFADISDDSEMEELRHATRVATFTEEELEDEH